MADIWGQLKRSAVMSLIRSTGNKSTELKIIQLFNQHHIVGWRRLQRVPGKPDFVFRRRRLCVFVDGCFWHGCPKCYRRPGSNRKYWDLKVQKNRARDRLVKSELRKRGWRVLRIWEHELSAKRRASLLRRLLRVGLGPSR